MSAIVFVGQIKPEKNLEMTYKYKAYLSTEEKEKIIKELNMSIQGLDNGEGFFSDEYNINMYVDIEIKKYKKK